MGKIEVNTVILVHGFIMLKGMNHGKYYIATDMDDYSITFVLTDKKGNRRGKKQVRHRITHLDGSIGCFERGDNNGIEIIKN